METKLQGLINGTGINASIKESWNDNADEWAQGKARHYRVKIKYQGRSMSLWYYQGLGITRDPKAADILECIASDSRMEYDSLDDFINEFGLEIKSVADFRKYEKQFKELKSQNKRFNKLINNPELVTRLQEII